MKDLFPSITLLLYVGIAVAFRGPFEVELLVDLLLEVAVTILGSIVAVMFENNELTTECVIGGNVVTLVNDSLPFGLKVVYVPLVFISLVTVLDAPFGAIFFSLELLVILVSNPCVVDALEMTTVVFDIPEVVVIGFVVVSEVWLAFNVGNDVVLNTNVEVLELGVSVTVIFPVGGFGMAVVVLSTLGGNFILVPCLAVVVVEVMAFVAGCTVVVVDFVRIVGCEVYVIVEGVIIVVEVVMAGFSVIVLDVVLVVGG